MRHLTVSGIRLAAKPSKSMSLFEHVPLVRFIPSGIRHARPSDSARFRVSGHQMPYNPNRKGIPHTRAVTHQGEDEVDQPGTRSPHPIGLLGLGVYLPERVMTNDEWTEYVDTSDEWIVTRTGIHTRRIAGDEESTADLALAAARAALADGAFEPADIDEIVLATDTPEVFIPDTAAYVQTRLGVGHIPCYDLGGSGCAGFVLALDIARSRALADGRRVLVIGVELLTRLMDWEDRNTCVLFGDAAGAAVVGSDPGAVEIVAATAGTDGSKSHILGVEAGGTRVPTTVERVEQGLHKHVVMRGREVFREAVSRMSAASLRIPTMPTTDSDKPIGDSDSCRSPWRSGGP